MKKKHLSEKTKQKIANTLRKYQIWTPQNTEDGWIDNDGRFRVYLPTHSRASLHGYVFRSIVHYEYFNNDIITFGYDIHHKDGNRLNDSKENLEKIKHGYHTKLHCTKPKISKKCLICGKIFLISSWRFNNNSGFYCSRKCYYKSKLEGKYINCKICGQPFWYILSRNTKYCSKKCYGISKRKNGN